VEGVVQSIRQLFLVLEAPEDARAQGSVNYAKKQLVDGTLFRRILRA
jgi:hypothetical protein